jgi:hypothetical protein
VRLEAIIQGTLCIAIALSAALYELLVFQNLFTFSSGYNGLNATMPGGVAWRSRKLRNIFSGWDFGRAPAVSASADHGAGLSGRRLSRCRRPIGGAPAYPSRGAIEGWLSAFISRPAISGPWFALQSLSCVFNQ